jgi:hypothetical protein
LVLLRVVWNGLDDALHLDLPGNALLVRVTHDTVAERTYFAAISRTWSEIGCMRDRPDGLPLCPGFHGVRPFVFGLRLAISVFLSLLAQIAQASYSLPEIHPAAQCEPQTTGIPNTQLQGLSRRSDDNDTFRWVVEKRSKVVKNSIESALTILP